MSVLLRPKNIVFLVGLGTLLLATGPGAAAQEAPATPVPLAGVNLPKTYGQALALSLAIPSDYRESGYRQWSGPTFYDPKKPSVNGIAGIQWLVRLDTENGSAEAAATDVLSSTSKYSRWVMRGPVDVAHVSESGRPLGRLAGFGVIVQSVDPRANAQYQGAVAFRLARPTPMRPSAKRVAPFVVVRFKLETPPSDRYVVGSGAAPSAWNLERTRAALAGIRLIGSMPPGRMSVAVRARKVSGSVVDLLGHSVPGAEVTIYRVVPPVRKSAKPTFARVARTRTGAIGRYALLVPQNLRPGAYRIVARLGQSAVSRPLRLR